VIVSLECHGLEGLLVYVAGVMVNDGSNAIGMWLGRPLVSLLVVWNYLLQGLHRERVYLGIVMGPDGWVLRARHILVVVDVFLCLCWKEDLAFACQMRFQSLLHWRVGPEPAAPWRLERPVLQWTKGLMRWHRYCYYL
jgi:hypothetical protein